MNFFPFSLSGCTTGKGTAILCEGPTCPCSQVTGPGADVLCKRTQQVLSPETLESGPRGADQLAQGIGRTWRPGLKRSFYQGLDESHVTRKTSRQVNLQSQKNEIGVQETKN